MMTAQTQQKEIRCAKCGRLLAKQTEDTAHIRIRVHKSAYQDIYITGEATITITCPKRFFDRDSVCLHENVIKL